MKKNDLYQIHANCLLMFENHPLFSVIVKQWLQWEDMHNQKIGGTCIMDSCRDILRDMNCIRFMLSSVSVRSWGTNLIPQKLAASKCKKKIFKNLLRKLERRAKKYLDS